MKALAAAGWVKAWIVPALLAAVLATAIWVGVRWAAGEHASRLGAVPLFSGLSPRQLRPLASAARRVEFPAGGEIVQMGDPSDAFYLLIEGEAGIVVNEDQKALLAPGGYFGEMAAIDGGPRSASVSARTHVAVLQVPSSALLRLVERDADLRRALITEFGRRLEAQGSPAPETRGEVTMTALVDACRRLRESQSPDWGQGRIPRRRFRLTRSVR